MKIKELIKSLQIPSTNQRVEKHTRKKLNEAIKQKTLDYIKMYGAAGYGELTQRLVELDREWDTPWRPAAFAYVVVAAALFLLFLPFLTALPVPETLWALRFPAVKVLGLQIGGGGLWTWFPSWI